MINSKPITEKRPARSDMHHASTDENRSMLRGRERDRAGNRLITDIERYSMTTSTRMKMKARSRHHHSHLSPMRRYDRRRGIFIEQA